MKRILLLSIMLLGISTYLSASTIEENKKACDGGDAGGCYSLGVAYVDGKGVKQDLFKAADLYNKACDGGDANGCFALEFAYGNAINKNSCDSGFANGCYNLGNSYANGNGVKQDYFKANALYKKACYGRSIVGGTNGCIALGFAYVDGKGVKQDDFKANALFKKACDDGSANGCFYIGLSYDKGEGVKQDDFKANAFYKKACDGGDCYWVLQPWDFLCQGRGCEAG